MTAVAASASRSSGSCTATPSATRPTWAGSTVAWSRPGYLADLNVIDLEPLACHPPTIVHDLPAGGRRLMQTAAGYRATVKSGAVTFDDGEHTGELPGGLLRGARGPASLSTARAAARPHMPCTPPPGGVDDEHR